MMMIWGEDGGRHCVVVSPPLRLSASSGPHPRRQEKTEDCWLWEPTRCPSMRAVGDLPWDPKIGDESLSCSLSRCGTEAAEVQTEPQLVVELERSAQCPVDLVFCLESSVSVGEQEFLRAAEVVRCVAQDAAGAPHSPRRSETLALRLSSVANWAPASLGLLGRARTSQSAGWGMVRVNLLATALGPNLCMFCGAHHVAWARRSGRGMTRLHRRLLQLELRHVSVPLVDSATDDLATLLQMGEGAGQEPFIDTNSEVGFPQ